MSVWTDPKAVYARMNIRTQTNMNIWLVFNSTSDYTLCTLYRSFFKGIRSNLYCKCKAWRTVDCKFGCFDQQHNRCPVYVSKTNKKLRAHFNNFAGECGVFQVLEANVRSRGKPNVLKQRNGCDSLRVSGIMSGEYSAVCSQQAVVT
jgi:hypothetical protein